jgi:undecaprenyl pyrophosphate synthase
VDHRVSKTKEPRAEASELRSQPPTREHRAAAKKVTKAYSSQLAAGIVWIYLYFFSVH